MTASSGYWRSQRWPVRDCRRTVSLSRKAMARTPSHLTSKSQPSLLGGCSPIIALMGSIDSGIAALRAPLSESRSILSLRLAADLTGAVLAAGADLRAAGLLLAQTRSDAPAVLRLLFLAGRFCAISCWVRPESTDQA